MRLERYSAEKLKQEIIDVLAQHINLSYYHIFFFGSRVIGSGTERSDIDVGIEGPPIPPSVWFDIRQAIENFPILYKIEIVDFNRVGSRFRQIALQRTEDIWNKTSYDKI